MGVVFYIAAMWIAGVMQGLMWRSLNADGTLTYTFVEVSRRPTRSTWGAWSAACCTWSACR